MKVVIDTAEDVIKTSEITKKHLVVAIIEGEPCILGKAFGQLDECLSFFVLADRNIEGNCITVGNGYGYSEEENSIQAMVEFAIKDRQKVEVFQQKDWKQALQWLIDNAQ